MRKGYLLIEILVIITVLVMIMPLFDRLFKVIVIDLPRDNRLANENIVLLNAIGKIRSDVAAATALSQDQGLVIKSADGEVSYRFENGVLFRKKGADGEMSWSLPHGKIEMRVRNDKYKPGAVELETCLEHWDNGKPRKKLANAWVFFAGGVVK